jgi:hypothetical protein
MKRLTMLSDVVAAVVWIILGIAIAIIREVILFIRDLVLAGYLLLCVGATCVLGFVLNPYVFGGLLFAYIMMRI